MLTKKVGIKTMSNKEQEKFIVSTSDLIYLFQISRKQISNWADAGCPKLARGKWNLREVIAWRAGNFVVDGEINTDNLTERQALATTLYREEKAKKEKIQREALEQLYIPKEEVAKEWAARILELKTGLANWRKGLPPQLAEQPEAVIEEVLEREVRDIFEQYYRNGTYTPKLDKVAAPGNSSTKATRKANGQ
jgi:hypothetical protein